MAVSRAFSSLFQLKFRPLSSFSRSLVLSLMTMAFVACGSGGDNGGSGNNSGSGNGGGNGSSDTNYQVLSGEIDDDGGTLSGSGQLVFERSLGSTDEQKSFQLNFELEEGSSVELHAFAGNQLEDGLNFLFERTSEGFSLKINGTLVDGNLNYDEGAEVAIDIHNNEGPDAHLIVEMGDEEVFNSASGGWGQGGGRYWGLTLQEATVNSSEVGDARHGH